MSPGFLRVTSVHVSYILGFFVVVFLFLASVSFDLFDIFRSVPWSLCGLFFLWSSPRSFPRCAFLRKAIALCM